MTIKYLTLLGLFCCCQPLYAVSFTPLNNTDIKACQNQLKQAPKAVVMYEYTGCPFAQQAQQALAEAKTTYSAIKDVTLFYFVGDKEQSNALSSDCVSTPEKPLSPQEIQWCKTAKVCLGLAKSSPYDMPSPTIYYYSHSKSQHHAYPTQQGYQAQPMEQWILQQEK